ncbi:homocysteine S-methyltransferase family protein [Agrococcus beijingensis]|uniref:homocysteine S-methyltransferase family protein n=1 Tax=Agrococcus beijingensis TaxID=3068634 RepID=UPI00274206AC|nr:homocysteine S-methyltransferase family protein [Agrococcus sp. REN33]
MSTVARRSTAVNMTTKPSTHHHVVPNRTTSAWPSAAHPYVTDGGLETDLIFNHGVQLREFAAYPLLRTERGRAMLDAYYDGYAEIARRHSTGLLLETPTWRASADWGARLGDDRRTLYDVNVQAVRHLHGLRERYADLPEVLISGAIGPRNDAYADMPEIDPDEARIYHEPQIGALAEGGVDLVTAFTLSDPGEAIGIANAAFFHGLPAVIGFTVETDGRLRSGLTLREAIETVDAETDTVQYMINCAHPQHVQHAIDDGAWRERVVSVRYNASTKSHAELDDATSIDAGDIDELRRGHDALRAQLPGLAVVGGCCGTDSRHVAALWEERTPA